MKRYENRLIYIVASIGFGICIGFYLGNINSEFAYRGREDCVDNKKENACTPSQEHREVMQRLDTLEQGQTYLIDLLNK